MTRGLAVLMLCVAMLTGCSAKGGPAPVAWSTLRNAGALHGGQLEDGTEVLRVRGAGERIHVATFDARKIEKDTWSLRGRVRHELKGPAHLEMWSVFPDGARFFTKGLAKGGPMRSMEGSSDWRAFALPFFSKAGTPAPSRIELYVVFDGSGHVDMSPLTLTAFDPGEDPMTPTGAWWDSRTGGWLGGGLGMLLGVLGALVGMFAGRGIARRGILTVMLGCVVGGLGLLVLGGVAWFQGQAFPVVFPLMLGGGLMTGIFGPLIPVVRGRFLEIERRKMDAMDANPLGAK